MGCLVHNPAETVEICVMRRNWRMYVSASYVSVKAVDFSVISRKVIDEVKGEKLQWML